MITMRTVVEVKGISGKTVSDFMLNCTNEDYRNWWAGTHLAFHTTKRFPNDHGNLVYFDEYVGGRRLKFAGVVVKNIPGKEIVWQMKKLIKLPAWLFLQFEERDEGVAITHKKLVPGNGNSVFCRVQKRKGPWWQLPKDLPNGD